MEKVPQANKGLLSFGLAMCASMLSITGTAMTQFAVIAWAWQKTGSVTYTGLVTVATFVSVVLVSVFSGALVDRWNRKRTIIVTDGLSFLVTAAVLLLLLTDSLDIWHLVVLGVVLGVMEAFQFPAYLASVTQMVSSEQRPRANSMFQLSWSIADIASAALAGILFAWIGLVGILIIDLISFVVIITTISLLKIPQPERAEQAGESLLKEVYQGFTYLFGRPSVLWTVLVFTMINVAYGVYQGVFRPMILTLTSNNEALLGLALAAVGLGNMAGGAVINLWRTPKDRIPLILVGWSLMSAANFVLAGLGRSAPVWLIACFCAGVFNHIALVMSFAIWQDKVEESVQGRIFSIIRLLVQVSIPIAAFVATLLADNVAEPAMRPDGALSGALGWLFGTGAGAGMSLILVSAGLLFGVAFPLLGFFIPPLRNADRDRPTPEPELPGTADSVPAA